jgi:hypothetical protein
MSPPEFLSVSLITVVYAYLRRGKMGEVTCKLTAGSHG